MQRSDPIGRRRAVIADLPLVRQLSHREKRVLDHPQVSVLDSVMLTYPSRRQAP
jgi:hypothetical protein